MLFTYSSSIYPSLFPILFDKLDRCNYGMELPKTILDQVQSSLTLQKPKPMEIFQSAHFGNLMSFSLLTVFFCIARFPVQFAHFSTNFRTLKLTTLINFH